VGDGLPNDSCDIVGMVVRYGSGSVEWLAEHIEVVVVLSATAGSSA
jgi:hypothetical protein